VRRRDREEGKEVRRMNKRGLDWITLDYIEKRIDW
jgi:hypothetical protein